MEDQVSEKIRQARDILTRLEEIRKAEQNKRLIGFLIWLAVIFSGIIVGIYGYRYAAENYQGKLPWLFPATPAPVDQSETCLDLEIEIKNGKLMVPPDIVWGNCYQLVGEGVAVWNETFSLPENRRSLAESVGGNEGQIALVETAIEASFTTGILDLRSNPVLAITATPEPQATPTTIPTPTLLPAPEGVIPLSELRQVMEGMGISEVRTGKKIDMGEYSLWTMFYSVTDYLSVKIDNEEQLPSVFVLSTIPSEGASALSDLWMTK